MPRIVTTRKRTRVATPTENPRDRAIRAVSIAVVLLCAAFAAWRLLAPGGGKGAREGATPSAPSTSRASLRERPLPSANGAAPSQAEAGSIAPATPAAGRANLRERPLPSAEQVAPFQDADQREATTPAPPQVQPAPRERKVFDNEIENTIASVSEPGVEFFGFPPGTDMEDDEIIEILRRPVEITEDDDEATVAAKERTAEFKAKALKAITEDGLTFNQFVRDQVAIRNEQAAMREDAYQEMVKILRRDGEAAARDYLNSVNPELKAQGMKEIIISPVLLEDD